MKTGDDWIHAPERTGEELGQLMIMYAKRILEKVKGLEKLHERITRIENDVFKLKLRR